MSTNRYTPGPAYLRAAEELRDNPGQLALLESDSSCAVIAGPGSGKTKALTVKLARVLAEEVGEPRRVACITYSTECVRELQRRLSGLGVNSGDLFVGTVHGFCLRHVLSPYAEAAELGLPRPLTVATQAERNRAFARAAQQALGGTGAGLDLMRTPMEKHRRLQVRGRAMGLSAEDEDIVALATAYEQKLREAGRIDFDDIVLLSQRLIQEHEWVRAAIAAQFPVIAVDEYQDLGAALHQIVLDLANTGRIRIIAVGDQDQSIYSFTGAVPGLLEELADREDFERIVLPFNYRSAQELVDAAQFALGTNRGYKARTNYPGLIREQECPEGLRAQAKWVCSVLLADVLTRDPNRRLGDIAVLYADRYTGSIVAGAAESLNIPYQRTDQGGVYPRTPFTRWLEECAKWCVTGWSTAEPTLDELMRTWDALGPEGLSDTARYERRRSLATFLSSHTNANPLLGVWLSDFERECLGVGLDATGVRVDERAVLEHLIATTHEGGDYAAFSLSQFAGNRGSPAHLNLMTLHAAKGLEFDVVAIVGMDEGGIPNYFEAQSTSAVQEARRKFYVGLTRAKREVYLLYSGFVVDRYNRRHANGPSRFLLELRELLGN